ncbi:ABC transporter permease protein YxdM [Paenibacillus auburnensis]|uniref:ABC transporter permease protein YxdM n=1 Tax=Paenibacillus auburnensis TaxID=2905649 RepID=A0ABN8G1T5_9BACL|nr:ABC transporter permease [Paenibacillus auburnensis]CAH1194835.1 ABC transporter permease protein YxdM [Paenibacillus auburnensis]
MTFRQFAYRNVARNKRKYAAYFVSSAFSVMVFFLCALFIFHPDIARDTILSTAANTMMVAEGIIFVFSSLFMLVSVGSFLQSRKLEFSVLLMHGMTKGQLNKMVFLENMLIGSSAILTGTVLGLLLGKLFLMIGAEFLGIAPLKFYFSWQAPLLTVSSFALLFVLISLCTFAFIGRESPRGLFQSGRKAEQEPRVSPLLAVVSALLLLGGYGLAASATAASVEMVMFPVVAITVAGTYLFYTQLSLYIVKLLRGMRRFYWHKTHMIMLSGLSHRWKDNGRMFFMVTIVSAVSFTSVGVFASIHTLSRELKLDYPAAVGYVAKGSQAGYNAEGDLRGIRDELERLGLPYETLSIPVKYAEVKSQTGPDRTRQLPLMAYSDYKLALQHAGFISHEQPLQGNEGLVMIGSQRDRSLTWGRIKAVYTLEQGTEIAETGYTEHVPIAEYLLPELDGRDGGDFSGVVVSDSLFHSIIPAQIDYYTGFYVDDFPQTSGIAGTLADKGKVAYERDSPYAVVVSGTLFEIQKTLYSTMLFASLLVGTVFFIAAGSFLYFRLYTDLDHDRLQYSTLSKMGLTDQELDRSLTLQLALMFFVPVGIAIMHSLFAFIALQRLFYLSIAAETGAVLAGYLAAQGLYFILIRGRYLRNLKKNLI